MEIANFEIRNSNCRPYSVWLSGAVMEKSPIKKSINKDAYSYKDRLVGLVVCQTSTPANPNWIGGKKRGLIAFHFRLKLESQLKSLF